MRFYPQSMMVIKSTHQETITFVNGRIVLAKSNDSEVTVAWSLETCNCSCIIHCLQEGQVTYSSHYKSNYLFMNTRKIQTGLKFNRMNSMNLNTFNAFHLVLLSKTDLQYQWMITFIHIYSDKLRHVIFVKYLLRKFQTRGQW